MKRSEPARAGAVGSASSGPGEDVGKEAGAADAPTLVTGSSGGSQGEAELEEAKDLQIPGYRLVERLHRGGQGVVYRAVQQSTKRSVALKVMLEGPLATDLARRRFEREVELAASLRHPNIVTILDSGNAGGRYYFAMDFIAGTRLDHYLRDQKPDLETTLELFAVVADAVNFAHQRGVLHRDLKPLNVLVDAEGVPHVLDFGLAKNLASDPLQTTMPALSMSGQVLGTLAYMSPEQAGGATDVDVRSDVYSIGVMLYEGVLGQPPYVVEGPLPETISRIMHDDPTPPRMLRSTSRFGRSVDDELETILLKGLEKELERRYQTAGALADDLRRYLAGEPIEAKRASGLYMLRKTIRRYRVQAGAAAALLLFMVAFAISVAVLYTKERAARDEAERLRGIAMEKQEAALAAQYSERQARIQAELARTAAVEAAEGLRAALIRQTVQRGDLAWSRGDLAAARSSFWDAYGAGDDDLATRWALRQYYRQSGEETAWPLRMAADGEVAFSNDGQLAAVADDPQGVTLRDVQTGAVLGWHSTPTPVTGLDVGETGAVAAVGPGWLRVWEVDAPKPRLALNLADGWGPRAVGLVGDGGYVVVLGDRQALAFDTRGGRLASAWRSEHELVGRPAFAGRQVLCGTERGALLLQVNERGQFSGETLTLREGEAPRAVGFDERERILLVSDELFVGSGRGVTRQWQAWRLPGGDWRYCAGSAGAGRHALGAADGEVVLLEGAEVVHRWRVASGGLSHVQLVDDGKAVVTVDGNGVLTRWRPDLAERLGKRLHERPVVQWARSANGSAALIADDEAVYVYAPEQRDRWRALKLPRRLLLQTVRPTADWDLAISDDASIAVVRDGGIIWVFAGDAERPMRLRWSNPRYPILNGLALAGDGERVAFLAQTAAGDRQLLAVCELELAGRRRWRQLRGAVRPVVEPIGFIGSPVQELAFSPDGTRLLAARANGELVQVGCGSKQVLAARRLLEDGVSPPDALLQVRGTPERLTYSRNGQWVVVTTEDGGLNLVTGLDGRPTLATVPLPQRAAAADFDALGEVVFARLASGIVLLIDPASREPFARWDLGVTSGRPMIVSVGEAEHLLLGQDAAVREFSYGSADERIRENVAFAAFRRVRRALGSGQMGEALVQCGRWCEYDDARGSAAAQALLAAALRRPEIDPGPQQEAHVREMKAPMVQLRLAHAAFAGEHYDLAATLFEAVREAGYPLDTYSQWRLAECRYLADDFATAAEMLGEVARRKDLRSEDLMRIKLEQIAALSLNRELAEARSSLKEVDVGQMAGLDPLSRGATQVIGQFLAGMQGESQLLESVQTNVRLFQERWLDYSDDSHFFAAELARRKGDIESARTRYQKCVAEARDGWPSDWARWRLTQLSGRTAVEASRQ